MLSARGRGIDWNNKKQAAAYRSEYQKEWKKQRKEEQLRDDDGDLIQMELPFAMSHAEIAKELGITRQWVGQIERRALRKLKHAFLIAGIRHSSDIFTRRMFLPRRGFLGRIQMS